MQFFKSCYKFYTQIVSYVSEVIYLSLRFLSICLRLSSVLFSETLPSQSASNHATKSDAKHYTGSSNSLPVIEKKSATPNSEGDIPLYSNIEYHPYAQNRADILALQYYVVEQAKSLGKWRTLTYPNVVAELAVFL